MSGICRCEHLAAGSQGSTVSLVIDFEKPGLSPSFSAIGLGFNHLGADGEPGWEVGDIRLQRDDEDYGHWVAIERHIAPSADLDEGYRVSV